MTALMIVVRIPDGITPPRSALTISSIIASGLSAKASQGVHWSSGLTTELVTEFICFMRFKISALSTALRAQQQRVAAASVIGKRLPITGRVVWTSGGMQ